MKPGINNQGETVLHLLASKKDFSSENVSSDFIRLLLDKDFVSNINGRNMQGDTALHIAVKGGHKNLVVALCDSNADMVAKGHCGYTPFVIALQSGHKEIVQFFLERLKIEITKPLKSGHYPLDWAALGKDLEVKMRGGNVEVIELLIEKGADVNSRSKNGASPIRWAANSGHAKAVRCLLDHGAYVDAVNDDGDTALMGAVYECSVETVSELLKARSDVQKKNSRGETALYILAGRTYDSERIVVSTLIMKLRLLSY